MLSTEKVELKASDASGMVGGLRTRRWYGWCVLLAAALMYLPLAAVHRFALWLDRWLFPALSEVRIERPLFLVGLPRSGTTLLHRLFASAEDSFTTLPLWELIFAPALCQKYCIGAIYRIDQWFAGGGAKGPLERCVHWIASAVARAMDEVHPTDLCAPEEDYLALLPYEGCFLRVIWWPHSVATWQLGYFDRCLPKYRKQKLLQAYRGILQRHLQYRGVQRIVLSKNPGFAAWIEGLWQEFPDACFVGLRRSPSEAVPSQLSSIRGGVAAFGNSVYDPRIVDGFARLLAYYWACLEQNANKLGPGRFRVIEYRQLLSMNQSDLAAVLQGLSYEVSSDDACRLSEQLASSKNYRSRHEYSLTEFGLSEAYINDLFAPANKKGAIESSCQADSQFSSPQHWITHGCSKAVEPESEVFVANGDTASL